MTRCRWYKTTIVDDCGRPRWECTDCAHHWYGDGRGPVADCLGTKIPLGALSAFADLPCVHRSNPRVVVVPGPCCGGTADVDVADCARHGLVSLYGLEAAKACLRCGDRG